MSCICQTCGRSYRVDLIVPDELWEMIKPKHKLKGAGLMCGYCILNKLEAAGYVSLNADNAALRAQLDAERARVRELEQKNIERTHWKKWCKKAEYREAQLEQENATLRARVRELEEWSYADRRLINELHAEIAELHAKTRRMM